MAHYAFLDQNNVVVEVIYGRNETETVNGVGWEIYYGNQRGLVCKRTSYNTYYAGETIYNEQGEAIGVTQTNSQHTTGGTPFRGQFASVGDIYDYDKDAFFTPTAVPHE
jgi:hypothetical protein